MKILLIGANVASTPYYVYPLGIAMVSSTLKNAGHTVRQIDFLQNNMSLESIENEIRSFSPDIIGISMRNIDNVNLLNEQRYIDAVGEIVKRVRQVSSVPVVMGGSGFSIMPEAVLDKIGADYGIAGEGESLMVQFADDAQKGIYPEKRCIRSSNFLQGKQIPSACYDPDIMQFYLKSGNIASVQTKRGCNHKCIYCSYPLLEGAAVRLRDPASVVNDIESLINDHKVGYIFFTDSVFNDDDEAYLEVVSEMKNRNINIPWTAFFKPEGLKDEHIALMKETGLKAVEIGADASTDTTLKRLGKPFRFKDIALCNDLFARHQVATAHFYMFGCPGETRDTVIEGLENIKSLKNTVSFIFMGIRILPNTILHRIAVDEGLVLPDDSLLESIYYIAPGIERQWLEKTLTDGFSGIRNCVFPPDAMDGSLQFLHKLGYSGSLWDMLVPGGKKTRKHRTNAGK
ncbi:lipid biosynthesis B12-binding/radical SAM protein [Desulfobacterium sp. N47]|uniref:lipid biosynthesis B12-binding/radical SAM protein n=1 Tax=Desulfobacterium sp. N47 TaxID=3115210 RepID=UPI003CB6C872